MFVHFSSLLCIFLSPWGLVVALVYFALDFSLHCVQYSCLYFLNEEGEQLELVSDQTRQTIPKKKFPLSLSLLPPPCNFHTT